MNTLLIDKIANAVLYEGYLLYPYRPCVKTQRRWTFGCLHPRANEMRTECLFEVSKQSEAANPGLEIEIRFLQLVDRKIARIRNPSVAIENEANLDFVESFEIDGTIHHNWQEAIERRISISPVSLGELVRLEAYRHEFQFPESREIEPLSGTTGSQQAVIVRNRQPLSGIVELKAETLTRGLFKVAVSIFNTSSGSDSSCANSENGEAGLQSFVSTHTILGAVGGQFVSSIDPPVQWQEFSIQLRNAGTWPVFVGQEEDRTTMLSSPIILYDYPKVADESAGDLFDGTEIDEILALRIMTLTDEEKRRGGLLDERARELLHRTETLSDEHLRRLHGAIRELKSVTSHLVPQLP